VNGLRVAVVGGGLGGLCLAPGLLKAGIDVALYERAETGMGARHNRLAFWLYRRLARAGT
jgi:2-polyprenyl-6-methoxyphenol hydroxylase-like FAD-dependent oxidoreductase